MAFRAQLPSAGDRAIIAMTDDGNIQDLTSEDLHRLCGARALEKFGARAEIEVYQRSSITVAQVVGRGDLPFLKALGASPHAALEALWRKLR